VAEVMDTHLGTTDSTDACKLLLMSSLANVPNAVLGLAIPELVAYLSVLGTYNVMGADLLGRRLKSKPVDYFPWNLKGVDIRSPLRQYRLKPSTY